MLRIIIAAAFMICTVVQAQAVTLEEVIANNLEARGGANAIKKITSLKISGTFAMQGMETSFTQYFKGGNKVRMEVEVQGQKMINVFDGKNAWVQNPFGGGEATLAPADQAAKAEAMADFMGDLVNSAAKGLKLELASTEDLDGLTAYKIKVTRADSSISYTYVDAITWLEVRTDDKATMGEQTMNVERHYGNYKAIAGVQFPTSIEMLYNGQQAMAMKWDTTEVNIPIEDSLFAFPGTTKGK